MSPTHKYVVLTAIGPDKPGIVQGISRLIATAGANIEDSRMAILGGEFALILLCSGNAAALEAVDRAAAEFGEGAGLAISLRPTARSATNTEHLRYSLRVSGVDRPGIVFVVSELLAGRGVNVASLESEVRFAPHSGTPMFVLKAVLQVPSVLALSSLRAALASKCDEENLDFILESG